MILDARLLSTLQSCPRRLLLEADWEVLKWKPKRLLDATLREALLSISHGTPPAAAASSARARFLQIAANPGLDVAYGADSYVIAKDYCAMLDTILRVAATWRLPALSLPSPVALNASSAWQPLSALGTDGMLHRFITIDRWGEGDLARELHGWYVFGDVCVTRTPMMLHVIEIGQTRSGRRASPWARAWRHPTMRNTKLHFAHKDGSAFTRWTPVYLADSRDADPDEWVEVMIREGVAERLVRTIEVSVPDDAVREDTISQLLQESRRADVLLTERRSATWRALPMSRAACDSVTGACPYQPCCHQTVSDVADLGLYRLASSDMLNIVTTV